MKRDVVRLAVDDDADVKNLLGSALLHLPALRGALVVGGDKSPIIVASTSVPEGKEIAEFLAAGEGDVEVVG